MSAPRGKRAAPSSASDQQELFAQRLASLLEVQALKVFEIPVADIEPAETNPNAMSVAEIEGVRQSLLLYGPVKAGMVRPFDDSDRATLSAAGNVAWIGKRWEMLDAHHRRDLWLDWISNGLPDNAHPRLRELVERKALPCTIHPMSREVGKHMRLVLTFGHGTPQEIPAGKLAHELLQVMPMEALLLGLPWTETQAQNLVQTATFDWQAHMDEQRRCNEIKGKAKALRAEQFKIVITGPATDKQGLVDLILAYCQTHPEVKVKP
jgi:hypothetical protein